MPVERQGPSPYFTMPKHFKLIQCFLLRGDVYAGKNKEWRKEMTNVSSIPRTLGIVRSVRIDGNLLLLPKSYLISVRWHVLLLMELIVLELLPNIGCLLYTSPSPRD